MDADLQFGDVGVFLNIRGQNSLVDLAEAHREIDPDLVNTVLSDHSTGKKILLAPFSPDAAEVVSGEAVRAVLDHLRTRFDYVIVDTASILNDVVLSVFDAADIILLVAMPDIPSVKDARLFFDIAEALDYPPENTFLVLNRVDKKVGIPADDIEESIKHSIQAQIPDEPRMILHSINQGTPIVLYNKPTPPGRALQQIARQLVAVFEEAESEQAA